METAWGDRKIEGHRFDPRWRNQQPRASAVGAESNDDAFECDPESEGHSSGRMKEDVPTFTWQEEYGAFGVSESQRQTACGLYLSPKRASSEVDVRAGICNAGAEIGRGIRSAIFVWMTCPGRSEASPEPTQRSASLHAALPCTPFGLRRSPCEHFSQHERRKARRRDVSVANTQRVARERQTLACH